MATKRQSYMTSEKLKIIQFAEEHGNRAAQREFGIAESNVCLWRKSKENLQKMPRLQRADCGRKAAWPPLKQDLMAWITEKRNNGLAIPPAMVRLKEFEISKDPKYEIPAGQFKASNHWCQRFMKRNGLSLRQKTTLAQCLPPDYEEKIVQFQRFIIKQWRAHSYPLHLVANMDESPIQFDMPSINRTVSKLARKLWRFGQLETKRIAWWLSWHAQEMVPIWYLRYLLWVFLANMKNPCYFRDFCDICGHFRALLGFFCFQVLILVRFVIFAIFVIFFWSRVFLASKKNPCYFCDFCGHFRALLGFFCFQVLILFRFVIFAIFAIFVTGVLS